MTSGFFRHRGRGSIVIAALAATQLRCAEGKGPPTGVLGSDPLVIEPAIAATAHGAPVPFVAKDASGRSVSVSWRVDGVTGGSPTTGLIATNGVYTPPSVIPAGDSVVVTAVLTADTTVRRSAPVFVVPTVLRADSYIALPRVVDQSNPKPTRFLIIPPSNAASVTFLSKDGGVEQAQPIGPHPFVMTFVLPASKATSGYLTGRLHNHVGSLDYRTAIGLPVKLANLSVNVRDAGQPDVTVTSLAADAQRSAYVLNLRTDEMTVGATAAIVSRALSFLGDNFDFVAVIATVTTNNNRTHQGVRNEVQGIGLPIQDNSQPWGGKGKLRGALSFPIDAFFDGADVSLTHEIGHTAVNFADDTVLGPGVPHWPLSSMANYAMGFSIPGSGAGGTFQWAITPLTASTYRVNANPSSDHYHPMDLYLMGLLPADSVPPMHVLARTVNANTLTNGAEVPGMTYTIADYIAVHGARVPAASIPREFTLAVVVLTLGRLLTPSEMAFFDNAAARAETKTTLQTTMGLSSGNASGFYQATGGRATLRSRLP